MPTASAPASSANLGPGFDILALALELRCVVTAEPAADWQMTHIGPERPETGNDLVLEAARRAHDLGPPLHLTVDNRIPIGRGMGSSAAAAAAGAAAAWRAMGLEPDPATVFQLVSDLEEHADNAAAAVYGGLVLCTAEGGVAQLPLHPSLIPLVAIPDRPLATSLARSLLPESASRQLVVQTLARVAALVAGLESADPALLGAAAGDELHEAPRNLHRPEVAKLIEVAREAGALHAAWSGAGPSVLAFVTNVTEGAVSEALRSALDGGVVERFEVARTGLK
ncbi:MAG TPA: homoserine kinase [Acidimicrobiia bacterium]|nr:homoserine kinase [Acidimicrobiia bacterium]